MVILGLVQGTANKKPPMLSGTQGVNAAGS